MSVTWLLMVTMTFLSGLIYLVFKTTWVILTILMSMVTCQQYFFYSTIFSNTFMKQEIIFDMSCKSNCIMIIKDVQKCFYIYNPKDHRIKQRGLARMSRKEESCILLICESIFVRFVQPLTSIYLV